MFYKWLVLITVFSITSSHSFAVDLKITDEERRSLPPYCTRGHPQFHTHFCSGLNYINRHNRARNKAEKSFNLGQAIGEFSYVINYFKNGWDRLHEAYFNRGLAYSLSGNWKQANDDWKMALKINPKMIHVYSNLADYYSKFNMNKMALEIVTEGLKHNPETKSLMSKYDKLGGQQPYPAPYESETRKVEENEIDNVVETKPELPPKETTVRKESTALDQNQPAAPNAPIGSPKNPWCRFCPETPVKPDPLLSNP